jgi:glycosyltransferase involved in cell wall biosynthesis
MPLKIGIYNQHMRTLGGGEKRTLVMAEHLSRANEVFLLVDAMPERAYLEPYFDVDLSRVQVVVLQEPRRGTWTFGGAHVLHNQRVRYAHVRQIRALDLDIFINNSHGSQLRCPARHGIYMCMFPVVLPLRSGGLRRLPSSARALISHFGNRVLHRDLDAFASYEVVTANSGFTSHWIETLWGRTAEIVYSVCDAIGSSPHKEKIILNVGRFDAPDCNGHHKRQEALLATFLKMRELHRDGWQLHFVGGLRREDPSAVAYAETLLATAQGAPVHLHFNAPLDQLRDLYRRASLYWHATGYGDSPDTSPHTQEHFGIATVEAMSAGAVPVVINSGGHQETVQSSINGFLWDDLEGLAASTRRLIADPALRTQMAERAMESSLRFSRAAFNAKVDNILERLQDS